MQPTWLHGHVRYRLLVPTESASTLRRVRIALSRSKGWHLSPVSNQFHDELLQFDGYVPTNFTCSDNSISHVRSETVLCAPRCPYRSKQGAALVHFRKIDLKVHRHIVAKATIVEWTKSPVLTGPAMPLWLRQMVACATACLRMRGLRLAIVKNVDTIF